MSFPDLTPAVVTGAKPVMIWIAPALLHVDGTYQRDLSRQSLKLIAQIYRSFAWNRIKPPVVVDDAGRYHVIDGQHTAIAAASLRIPELPCFLVEAAALAERARCFVGHNVDRIRTTPIAIHHALVAAGDTDALDVANVCRRAGVTIREFGKSSVISAGDTKAVSLIRSLIRKHGVIKTRKMLECLVKGELAPIPAGAITAVEHILCGERADVDLARLSAIIREDGNEGIVKAKSKAAKDSATLWSVLAARWSRRLDLETAA
jgi:hypothetical protein